MGYLHWGSDTGNCGDIHNYAAIMLLCIMLLCRQSISYGRVVLSVRPPLWLSDEERRMIIAVGPRLKNPHFRCTRHVA